MTVTARVERVTGLARRDQLPAFLAAGALLAWSLYAYLTLRIDGDMVAEMIQVQQWLRDPFWVLSYPGQLHGGVLEYPLEMLAELIAPGNPYGFTLIRVVYLPIVGLLACVNFRRLFPGWSLWPVTLAVAIGPAVLHGMMIIKDLYAFSYLLASIGVTILLRELQHGPRRWPSFAGGLLIGLAFYEQPTSMLFALPLVLAGVVTWRVHPRRLLSPAVGFVLGAALLVMAITMQSGKRLVFTPAGIHSPDLMATFGLSADADAWLRAIVPTGWGIQNTDLNALAFAPLHQFVLNSWLTGGLLVAVVLGVAALVAAARRRPPEPHAVIAVMWGSATLIVIALAVIVPSIFFYGTALAVLVWMTVGVLPHLGRPLLAVGATVLLLALMAVTTLGSFLGSEPKFKDALWFKQQKVDEITAVADAITAGGVHVIFGDYWEVLPIAYASAGQLHPLTVNANRFPLPADLAVDGEVDVAVPSGVIALPIGLGRWRMADDARARVEAGCRPRADLTMGMPESVAVYRCPVAVVDPESVTDAVG